MSASIDYFVERLATVAWIWDRVSLRPAVPPPCWYSWILLGIWPALVVMGLIIQCAITGRGTYHEDGNVVYSYCKRVLLTLCLQSPQDVRNPDRVEITRGHELTGPKCARISTGISIKCGWPTVM